MATSAEHEQGAQGQSDQDPGGGREQEFQGGEKARFGGLVLFGLLLGVACIVVAWVVLGTDYAVPLLILTVVLLAAAVTFRLIAGRNRDPAASDVGGLPAQFPDPQRPLGDTAEAHDEINVHDFPLYNPGRRTAERLARGPGGTTRGMDEGGAAGRGGPSEGDRELVGPDEGQGSDLSTRGV